MDIKVLGTGCANCKNTIALIGVHLISVSNVMVRIASNGAGLDC